MWNEPKAVIFNRKNLKDTMLNLITQSYKNSRKLLFYLHKVENESLRDADIKITKSVNTKFS